MKNFEDPGNWIFHFLSDNFEDETKENSTLEEDFFVCTQNELIPVEVKSNRNQSKSLSSLIKNTNYSDITSGIKLGDYNVGNENNISTFPYFCAFKLKEYLMQKER